jgi:hypothetical protein
MDTHTHIYVFDVSAYTEEFLKLLLVPLGYTHGRNVSNRKFCIAHLFKMFGFYVHAKHK